LLTTDRALQSNTLNKRAVLTFLTPRKLGIVQASTRRRYHGGEDTIPYIFVKAYTRCSAVCL